MKEREGKAQLGGGKKLSGPGLVYPIIYFSFVKLPLLDMTEAWTAQGVFPKLNGRVGGKKGLKGK